MIKLGKTWAALVSLLVFSGAAPLFAAQKIAAPVTSLRVYLFDCGLIKGENPLDYGLNKGDVKDPDMVVPCYLIVHPKGTLMWDVGVIPDSAFKEGKPVTRGRRYGKLPQALVATTGGDWLSRGYDHLHCVFTLSFRSHGKCERIRRLDVAGPCRGTGCDVQLPVPEHIATYNRLRNSKTILLPNTDYDVFGDGTVVIKYAPGHTPGHQVLALRLPKTGPVLIAGDLWHYAAERTASRPPEW